MGISFTPEQEKVIKLHNRNILVSAAAGSGKTAVLVERIVRMICNEDNPVDIDRLLVVTFTNAAAAEMRERISRAIAARLEENPESVHLQRQATLVHNAQITTIDSFCLFVIRNNFNDIGLDPTFRVADEGELKLLKQDVLSALLEERFADADEERKADFIHCVECYAANGKEKTLEEHILNLYNFAMSFPWPEEWLCERMEDYHVESKEEMLKSPWMQFAEAHIRALADDIINDYAYAIRLAEEPDGPYMYGELLEEEKEALEKSLRADNFETLGQAISGLRFNRLPAKKDETVSSEKRELAKRFRSQAKDKINALVKKYFATPTELVIEQSRFSERALRQLLMLSIEFKQRLDMKKREKNILDFSDMEHFALNILLKKDETGFHATKTALEYRKYFAEVLIDEYQDSNLVQEYLLSAVSGEEEGNYNRFMVGDVKQSIYKFRLARPELFMEKYHTYSLEDSDRQRIDLHKNFRSRREVLKSVNHIFSQIMGETLGGIAYDDAAALYPGATYPCDDCRESLSENDMEESVYKTELLLIDKPTKQLSDKPADGLTGKLKAGEWEDEGTTRSDMSAKELEAFAIARRIKKLMQDFKVTDKVTGALRPLKYSDIVVLLRTNSGWDEIFKEVFANQGIPAHMTARTGYFSSTEIQTVMQFLRVLDNPLQDIPMYGVMKGIFGGFTEEEIAMVRLHNRKATLYEALCEYKDTEKNEALCDCKDTEKVTALLDKIKLYRNRSVYLPVRKLLQEIFADYGYLNYVTALPAGEQRKANVEMLMEKAADFEKTSYYGLFHFIRYMEQMEKYDVDYGEANTLDENADVVRIMSIHKSKGLEFPVTFVAGLSKKFNVQDTAKALIVDVDMGIGTDYIDPVRRISNKTLRKNIIAEKIRLDNLAEELRVLYVAMTRPKEKLILTAAAEDMQKKIDNFSYVQNQKEWELSYGLLTSASSYLDFILPAVMRQAQDPAGTESEEGVREASKVIGVKLLTRDELYGEEIKELVETAGREIKMLALKNAASYRDVSVYNKIAERFSYQYPHENLQKLYTKTTVSELKLAAMEEKEESSVHLFEEERIVPYIPDFMREKKPDNISGTTRGSAFHRVMELLEYAEVLEGWDELDYAARKKRLEDILNDFVKEGRLTDEYYQAVSVKKIINFLSSGLAKRMAMAEQNGQLYKEQPFVYGIDASRLNTEFPSEEKVLIQGIVDVFFIEDGKIVLLDYKTDVTDSGEALMERYRTQLDYYSEALGKMWHMPVKDQILYSFYLEKEIVKS